MAMRLDQLPHDPAALARMVVALDIENEKLRVALEVFRAMIFGARSEKGTAIVAGQSSLDLGDLATDVSPVANDNASDGTGCRTRRRNPVHRNVGALPKHLPRIEEVIEPALTECPCCSGVLHKVGQDITEVLDVVPAILRVLRTIRPKYACRACEAALVQAPAKPRLVIGGMASTALIAHVATMKFAWHAPLYRQVQMFAGQGITLDRATLAFWIKRAAWWLRPLQERLLLYIRSHPRILCDETPLPRLDPGRGHTKVCQLRSQAVDDRPWQGPARPAVGYVFAEGRDTAAIADQLASFSGILQVDGYAAYKKLARGRGVDQPIQLAFCLAHARRKFVKLFKTTGSAVAADVIARIAAVYVIEARINGCDAETRRAVRQDETMPIMASLKTRLMAVMTQISTQSTLAEAINYMLHHWDGLVAFIEDGRIEVDSNIVERTMRAIGLGRKNSLFAGSEGGGRSWAILASLVNSAKLNGFDPFTYLADVLEQIVSGRVTINRLDELLPWSWQAAREAAFLAASARAA
jgi:transposase